MHRVPENGWTTQKVFHLLNAFVCILRCVVFALRDKVSNELFYWLLLQARCVPESVLWTRPVPCTRQLGSSAWSEAHG